MAETTTQNSAATTASPNSVPTMTNPGHPLHSGIGGSASTPSSFPNPFFTSTTKGPPSPVYMSTMPTTHTSVLSGMGSPPPISSANRSPRRGGSRSSPQVKAMGQQKRRISPPKNNGAEEYDSDDGKGYHMKREDWIEVSIWFENPANRKLFYNEGKTRPGGTVSQTAACRILQSHMNVFWRGKHQLKGDQMKTRWKNYRIKFRAASDIWNATGSGITEEDLKEQIEDINVKCEKTYPAFCYMFIQIGHKPNVTPGHYHDSSKNYKDRETETYKESEVLDAEDTVVVSERKGCNNEFNTIDVCEPIYYESKSENEGADVPNLLPSVPLDPVEPNVNENITQKTSSKKTAQNPDDRVAQPSLSSPAARKSLRYLAPNQSLADAALQSVSLEQEKWTFEKLAKEKDNVFETSETGVKLRMRQEIIMEALRNKTPADELKICLDFMFP